MKTKKRNVGLSMFFALSSLTLLLIILAAITNPSTIEQSNLRLGHLFFDAFSYAALYLPAYLAVISYLLAGNKASKNNLLLLNLTFIPFLTLALAFKTALLSFEQMSIAEQTLMKLFNEGAPIVLGGLLALEVLLLTRIAIILDNHQSLEYEEEHPVSPSPVIPSSPVEESFPVEKKRIESAPEPKTEWSEPVLTEQEPIRRDQSVEHSSIFNLVEDQKEELPFDAKSFPQDDFDEPEGSLELDEEEPAVLDNVLHQKLEEIAYGGENFSFLDDSGDVDASSFQRNGNKEFLEEWHSLEHEPKSKSLEKPHIDVEQGFNDQKEFMADTGFMLDEDPGVGLLAEEENLPPHLRRTNLLTPEEEQALSQVAEEIAQNSVEENQIATLIEDASKKLDRALMDQAVVQDKGFQASFTLPNEGQKKNIEHKIERSLEKETDHESFVRLPESSSWQQPETPVIPKNEDEEDLSRLHMADEPEILSLHDTSEESDDELTEEESEPFESVDEVSAPVPYKVPVEGLLDSYKSNAYWEIDEATTRDAYALESTLKEFNIEAKVIAIRKGPVVTMFELLPAPGVKLSKIENLADNIAFRLAASRVRIVAPIPGKQAVGIEIPNRERSIVSFSELIASDEMHDNMNYIPIALGKDIEGINQVIDLSKTPHLLIAGSTGSGKSVCVNSIICSILYTRNPRDVRLILIDPKVVELKPYNDIPHLLAPVITEPKKALQAVQWAMYEMERRYNLLDGMGAKNIRSYNKKIKEKGIAAQSLPYIVLIIDEFADLIASCGKELEIGLARLAAKSRAAGIHLILATQRPSADVITGLIKANFPSRIAFMVASKVDSRIILDMGGAEQLLGKGDMLFTSSWNPFATRMQSAFLSEEEVDRITSYVKSLGEPDYIDDEMFYDEESDSYEEPSGVSDDDPLFDKALDIVIEQRKASASYLQRRLKIGYNRAARLVELMEERGIVGPANGSKPRDLLKIPI